MSQTNLFLFPQDTPNSLIFKDKLRSFGNGTHIAFLVIQNLKEETDYECWRYRFCIDVGSPGNVHDTGSCPVLRGNGTQQKRFGNPDAGIYNHAGPEIGVASTKNFTSQLTTLTLLALLLGRHQNLSLTEGVQAIRALEALPDLIEKVLAQANHIEAIAEKYYKCKNWLFLGRKYNYPIALEGALKLKEVSYIHAEGYAAGEMKHGPIALINPEMPTVAIIPRDEMHEKMVSNIHEIKSRKGPVIAIATEGDDKIREVVDDLIEIPPVLDFLNPILAVVACQLLAYYCANFPMAENNGWP